MSIIGIIPARYASTRFPGKPLALIHQKPMIQWVYEQAKKAPLDKVVVATDDERIEKIVHAFGGEAVMTSPNHPSGTDRCGEAAKLLNLKNEDIIVNIQGDEPFIRKEEIETLIQQFDNQKVNIATLIKKIDTQKEDIGNPNMVKVIFSKSKKTIYFSRFPIPYVRSQQETEISHYKHIGIYAYRYETLKKLIDLPKSELEIAESLEQLRWLENDFSIFVAECFYESIAIDTPEDLMKIKNYNFF